MQTSVANPRELPFPQCRVFGREAAGAVAAGQGNESVEGQPHLQDKLSHRFSSLRGGRFQS
jgi:hypothetical protein